MTKSIKFVRRDLRWLAEKIGNPSATAKKKIDMMKIRRITVASDCRAIITRRDIPLDGKQQKWSSRVAKHLNWVEDFKATALDDLKEPYEEAQLLQLQASEFSRHRPKENEWSEFQARSPLLREQIEELAETTPSKIIEMYTKAEKLDDSITCFAIEEFGPAAIEKVRANPEVAPSDRQRFTRALSSLKKTINESSPEREALTLKALAIQKDITAAEQELKRYMLPSEEELIREKFHMPGDRVPSLFLECGLGYVQQEYLAMQVEDDQAWERQIIMVDTDQTTSMQEKVEGKVRKLKTTTE